MKKQYYFLTILLCAVCSLQTYGQQLAPLGTKSKSSYTFKNGDLNGIGKWYMGREISRVMGYHAIDWLERSERDEEENTKTLILNMDIKADDVIADIGAGSGYHVFKMAPLATQGIIYAVDIQSEMLRSIAFRIEDTNHKNIELIKSTERDVNLEVNTIDKALLVDVYHEFDYPKEMMASIYKALKKDGQLFLVEYRAEDETVPIKKLHKISQEQAVKEMKAAGFKLKENITNLPWQHCMIFVKM